MAQDSLTLTLQQADSLFLKNNLQLLAERFRIDASQAQVIQASLYDNPTVSVELSTYNNETKRVLDVGRQGQKTVAIEQLLYTAGKRNKRIALAAEAAHLTGLEMMDLLRGLRFDLRTRFYSIYFQRQTLARFDQQLATLQTTVSAYEKQYGRNNVSLRELLRLKALLFQLNNDRTSIIFQLADDERALRTISAARSARRYVTSDGATSSARSAGGRVAYASGRTELQPSTGPGRTRCARWRSLRSGRKLHQQLRRSLAVDRYSAL
jgi:outer membrane protein, heavy metal efflux system